VSEEKAVKSREVCIISFADNLIQNITAAVIHVREKRVVNCKVIESVKKDGTFIMYSETIPAYLSDNGKYLMVYSNPATSDKNSDAYKTMQSAVKAFKSFKADSTEEATEKATEKTK
jgi:hypothetical protein